MIYKNNMDVLNIGRVELALELSKLYYEIEEIDTDEIVKLGTFKS